MLKIAIYGKGGIGKSTIVNEIAYHLMMTHGLTLGVMALEEIATRWLWQQRLCGHTGGKHEGERCGSDEAFCR